MIQSAIVHKRTHAHTHTTAIIGFAIDARPIAVGDA